MVNKNFPCNQNGCTKPSVSIETCNNIGDTLLAAGAGGFFEVSACPMEVFTALLNAEDSERIARIKYNLGIVSIESSINDELN